MILCNDPYFYGSKDRRIVVIRSLVLLSRSELSRPGFRSCSGLGRWSDLGVGATYRSERLRGLADLR